MRDLKLILLGALLSSLVLLVACGIGRASGNAYAVAISGPDGVRCYAIIGGQGEAVGGNCLPQ